MCGIAGFLTEDRDQGHGVIRRMCAALRHRGPDSAGYHVGDGVALGHRRLSIIDLSGGSQPLGNEDGSLIVVFNGEIYNFLELRRDLLRRGHQFSSISDTEVLVHLYEDFGEDMPKYLNGMFSFAIWDRVKQELFLARDRVGEKPLYYSTDVKGTTFCFASELGSILEFPHFQPVLDPVSLAEYLSFSYVPEPRTIYRGVHKLEPGCSLTVTRNGFRKRTYWSPRFQPGAEVKRTFECALEELQLLAASAVKMRLVSDVPLGAFLSGGVDSSGVVGYMSEAQPDLVKTFSIGFCDKHFDEAAYARSVAARYRTQHTEHYLSEQVEPLLEIIGSRFDEPFGDSSAIPLLHLARMTREHVTVALSGDGADEVFGGYRRYYFGVLEEKWRTVFPNWFRKSVVKKAGEYYPKADYLPQPMRAKTLLMNLANEIGDAYYTSMSTFRDRGLDDILAPDLRNEVRGTDVRSGFRERFRRVSHLDPLQQLQSIDFDTYLPGDILVKTDRATMAYSLEARAPWLDHRLIEFACQLPSEWKIQGQVTKHIFKEALRPKVPAEIISRQKMGFSIPLASLFRGSLKPVFERLVLSGMDGLICSGEAKRLFNEHLAGFRNHDRKLWNLLALSLWAQQTSPCPTVHNLESIAV